MSEKWKMEDECGFRILATIQPNPTGWAVKFSYVNKGQLDMNYECIDSGFGFVCLNSSICNIVHLYILGDIYMQQCVL